VATVLVLKWVNDAQLPADTSTRSRLRRALETGSTTARKSVSPHHAFGVLSGDREGCALIGQRVRPRRSRLSDAQARQDVDSLPGRDQLAISRRVSPYILLPASS